MSIKIMKNLLYASLSLAVISLAGFGSAYLYTLNKNIQYSAANFEEVKDKAISLMDETEGFIRQNSDSQKEAISAVSRFGKTWEAISLYCLALGFEEEGIISPTNAQEIIVEACKTLDEVNPTYSVLLEAFNDAYQNSQN